MHILCVSVVFFVYDNYPLHLNNFYYSLKYFTFLIFNNLLMNNNNNYYDQTKFATSLHSIPSLQFN